MKRNFESQSDPQPIDENRLNLGNGVESNSHQGDLPSKTFELLSAFIDEEVNASERRQVQEWLDTDPDIKRVYLNLKQLRAKLQAAPVPKTYPSVQKLAAQVFRQIDRRMQLTLAWGGTAIAALFMATVSGVMPSSLSPMSEFAETSIQSDSEPLQIALNEPVIPIVNPNAVNISVDQPIIPIPKAPVSKSGSLDTP